MATATQPAATTAPVQQEVFAPDPEPQSAPTSNVQMPEMPLPQTSALLEEAIQKTMAADKGMVDGLTKMDYRLREWSFNQRLANAFAASGQFEDMRNLTKDQAIATALLKIELGRTMGYEAADSMSIVHLIKGRVSIAAKALAARLRREGYDWTFVVHTDQECEVLVMKDGNYIMEVAKDDKGKPKYQEVIGEDKQVRKMPVLTAASVRFTVEQAKTAGLTKDGSGWTKYPADMLWARVITRIVNRYAPEIMHGVNVITTEEARDLAADSGPQRPNLPIGNRADGTFAVEKAA